MDFGLDLSLGKNKKGTFYQKKQNKTSSNYKISLSNEQHDRDSLVWVAYASQPRRVKKILYFTFQTFTSFTLMAKMFILIF